MITYLIGDATFPIETDKSDNKIIAHVCNDIGGWGRGFVLAISKRWSNPRSAYVEWHKKGTSEHNKKFRLGEIQIVHTSEKIYVANMVAQHDIYTKNGVPPIRYDALEECFLKVLTYAQIMNASIHIPRIGCGLAGGSWEKVEQIISRTTDAINPETNVFVYDLVSQ